MTAHTLDVQQISRWFYMEKECIHLHIFHERQIRGWGKKYYVKCQTNMYRIIDKNVGISIIRKNYFEFSKKANVVYFSTKNLYLWFTFENALFCNQQKRAIWKRKFWIIHYWKESWLPKNLTFVNIKIHKPWKAL